MDTSMDTAKQQIGTLLDAASQNAGIGFGDGNVGAATKAAAQQIKSAAVIVSKAIQVAEQTAVSRQMHADGRAEAVEQITSNMTAEFDDAIGTAESALIVAQANVSIDARPEFAGNQSAAQSLLDTVLSRTPLEWRAAKITELAKRDSDLGGFMFTEAGREIMAIHGIDSDVIKALDVYTMQAAEHSSSPKRRQAFADNQRIAKMRGSLDAAKSGALAAQRLLMGSPGKPGLHAKAGFDPRDAELARLRRNAAIKNGHSQ